ncbi:hypothetical protein QTP86_013003 [Hemibagrus guttatus]|nr:hypothetical protein QTP86_013003 [Hemibagrus guttatus]
MHKKAVFFPGCVKVVFHKGLLGYLLQESTEEARLIRQPISAGHVGTKLGKYKGKSFTTKGPSKISLLSFVDYARSFEEIHSLLSYVSKNQGTRMYKLQQYLRNQMQSDRPPVPASNATSKPTEMEDDDELESAMLNISLSKLQLQSQGSHPVIMMESYDNSGGINLVCESRGWNPEPEVLWLDREGATLPAEDTQIHRDIEGFTVKRRITVYDYSDSNRFYCRLQQTHHMLETEVIINTGEIQTGGPHSPTARPDEAVLPLRGLGTSELLLPRERDTGTALIDSGAAVNLIDGALVERLGILTFPCVPALRITAIDSQPIGEGYLK